MSGGGPASHSGKAVARWNSTRHGITSPAPVVPGLERKEDWEEHRDGVLESLAPSGALETNLAERAALMLWRLHRVTRYETETISLGVGKVEDDVHERRRFLSSMQDGPFAATHPEDVRFEARHNRASHNALKRFMASQRGTEERLRGQDASAVIFGAYIAARKLTGAEIELENLDLPGIPEEHDVYEPPPMKARDVSGCVEAIATAVNLDPEELLESATKNARLGAASSAAKAEQTEKEVEEKRRERTLPDEKTLEKISRYESHLSRQLYHALHELENLQKRRLTGEGTPLARLDIQGLSEG